MFEIGCQLVKLGAASKRDLFVDAQSYAGIDYYPDGNTHFLAGYLMDGPLPGGGLDGVDGSRATAHAVDTSTSLLDGGRPVAAVRLRRSARGICSRSGGARAVARQRAALRGGGSARASRSGFLCKATFTGHACGQSPEGSSNRTSALIDDSPSYCQGSVVPTRWYRLGLIPVAGRSMMRTRFRSGRLVRCVTRTFSLSETHIDC